MARAVREEDWATAAVLMARGEHIDNIEEVKMKEILNSAASIGLSGVVKMLMDRGVFADNDILLHASAMETSKALTIVETILGLGQSVDIETPLKIKFYLQDIINQPNKTFSKAWKWLRFDYGPMVHISTF